MTNKKLYDSLSEPEKAEIVKGIYDERNPLDNYATSRDFNLRELEIEFIIDSIRNYFVKNPSILDIGCGNGYTDIRIAELITCSINGIDFNENMIKGAREIRDQTKNLKGKLSFNINDMLNQKLWEVVLSNSYDIVITERLLLNLPSKQTQYDIINKIHRVLKHGGLYLMVEGTKDGLKRLNKIRLESGLKEITDRSEDNIPSIKFDEKELEKQLDNKFIISYTKYWSIYYLVSRVIYPLSIYPKRPKWESKENLLAKIMQLSKTNNLGKLGHIRGLVLRKI